MKYAKYAIAVLVVLGFISLGINNIVSTDHELKLKDVQLKDTSAELLRLQLDYDRLLEKLNNAHENSDTRKETIDKLEREKRELENRANELEQKLSAKREAQRVAREKANNAASFSSSAQAAEGGREDWIAAADIPKDQWQGVIELISRESSWNPNAVNPSSGACGLGQQLPCGKWSHKWNDPVGGLIDAHNYVMGRYGSWYAAIQWHDANNWY